MDKVQKLLEQSIKIGEYNYTHIDIQLCEDYYRSDLYQTLTDEEQKLYDVLFGNDSELTKIILTGENVLNFIKGLINYNGYYDDELDEEELNLFLNKFIFHGSSVYRSLKLFLGIAYSHPNPHTFNSYNEEKYQSNITDQNRFKQVSILDLGEDLYMVFPLMEGSDKSTDYLVLNIMQKLLNAEYVMDSDIFFEFYKIYDDYRQSYLSGRILDKDRGDLPLTYEATKVTQDQVFKNRYEKSLNPEFKLHLKIYEISKEFVAANKEDAAYIYEASKNYNPTIKKVYELYEHIGNYIPFMTDADYLILNWIRYKIAVNKGDFALAEELGLNILKNKTKLKKLPKTFYIYTNYILPCHGSKGIILRDFSNDYADQILSDLLNYYVKNYRYNDAYVILKEHDNYFRQFLEDTTDEISRKLIISNLKRDVKWDIGLIIADLECTFDESIKNKWLRNIERIMTEFNHSKTGLGDYNRYKKMSQYFSNLIIIMISIEDYEIAKLLLTLYSEFLIKDEDYIALERFVARESMLKSNIGTLEEMLGLFSLESQASRKFIDRYFELTDPEMTKEISLSESEKKVINIIAKGNNSDYGQCLELIKNAQQKYINKMDSNGVEYDFYSNYFNEGLNKLAKLVKDNPTYKEVENSLKNHYGNSWGKFHFNTKNYLVTGNVLYHSLISRNDFAQFDYSPICLCWAKSIENELQKKFYLPLIRAYNNSLYSDGGVKYQQSAFLDIKNPSHRPKKVKPKNFTLGSLTYISGLYSDGKYRNEEDWNRFRQFLKENVYTFYNNNEMKDHIASLIKMSETLNYDYRIKAAHPLNLINKTEIEKCQDIIFKSQELLRKIVNDMGEEWNLKSLSFK